MLNRMARRRRAPRYNRVERRPHSLEETHDVSRACRRHPVHHGPCGRDGARHRRRPLRRPRRRHRALRARGSGQIRGRRSRTYQPHRRPGRLPPGRWRRDDADRLEGRLQGLGRRRLAGPAGTERGGRHGPAEPAARRLHGHVGRGQHGLHARPGAELRRRRRARRARLAGTAGEIRVAHRQRRMAGDDEPHRAAGGLRPQRPALARRAGGRRHVPHHGPEDLHHLRRARPFGQHHPPRAGAASRRALRHQGHFAFSGAEVPRQ